MIFSLPMMLPMILGVVVGVAIRYTYIIITEKIAARQTALRIERHQAAVAARQSALLARHPNDESHRYAQSSEALIG